MYDIREINTIEALEELRPLWQSLLSETPDANFFYTLDWLLVYWRHYGAGQRLRTLVVYHEGQPLGILPMVVRRERRKIGSISVLTYPLDDWGSWYSPLGPCPQETLTAGIRHFLETERDWDVFDVRWVAEHFDARRQTESALADAPLPTMSEVRSVTALIDLNTTWDAYLQSFTTKWRNNFKRWQRRLSEQGELQLVRYRPAGSAAGDDDPRWDLYDTCEEIASRSWQGASSDGTTLSSESIRPYLRDLHQAAARTGNVEINLLMAGTTPLAYAYNYYHWGRIYGLRIGYDPQSARDGAGNVLYAFAVRDSFERGDTLYDMGPGSLDYKQHWATQLVPLRQYTHFNPASIKGRLLHSAHRTRRWLRERNGSPHPEAAA